MLQNFHSHVVPTRNPENSDATEFSLSCRLHWKPQKQSCYRIFTFTLSPLETPKRVMLRNFHSHVVPTQNPQNIHATEFSFSLLSNGH